MRILGAIFSIISAFISWLLSRNQDAERLESENKKLREFVYDETKIRGIPDLIKLDNTHDEGPSGGDLPPAG